MPPTLTGIIHSDLLSSEQVNDRRIPSCKAQRCHKSLKVTHVFISQKTTFLEVANSLLDFSPSLLPLSLHFVQKGRNVVSLLMWTKTDCPFFVFYSQKQPCERHPGRHVERRVIIKHRSHSILTQLLLLLTAA